MRLTLLATAALILWSALVSPVTASAAAASPARQVGAEELALELATSDRVAGTASARSAAEIARRMLGSTGLVPVISADAGELTLPRRLSWQATNAGVSGREHLAVYSPERIPPGPLPAFCSGTASGRASGAVVQLGAGSEADLESLRAGRLELGGAIGLLAVERELITADVLARAASAGLLGLLVHDARAGSDREARLHFRLETPGVLPCVVLRPSEAQALSAELRVRRLRGPDGKRRAVAVGPGPVTVALSVELAPPTRLLFNVTARLAGESDSTVIVAAGLDAFDGRDPESARAAARLLQVADALTARTKQGWKPRSTIVFALWDGSRHGGVGARAWLAKHPEAARGGLAYLDLDGCDVAPSPCSEAFAALTSQVLLPPGTDTREAAGRGDRLEGLSAWIIEQSERLLGGEAEQ